MDDVELIGDVEALIQGVIDGTEARMYAMRYRHHHETGARTLVHLPERMEPHPLEPLEDEPLC